MNSMDLLAQSLRRRLRASARSALWLALASLVLPQGEDGLFADGVGPAPAPKIIVDATGGTPISRRLYGANDIWFMVPAASFRAYSDSLRKNAGATLLRYPGGFESEHYHWNDNTLDPSYRYYTALRGASPEEALQSWGGGSLTFVVKTSAALNANTPSGYRLGADAAADLVTRYGGRVQDWEIGNEWFNLHGARQDESEYLRRYSTLVSYYAPAMKAAAARSGRHIRIYIGARWMSPGDMTTMRQIVPPATWAQVDGLDIHVYTGLQPPPTAAPVGAVGAQIGQIKKASGKGLIYVSEWAAALRDNDRRGGLENANVVVQVIGQFALAGVSLAAYWPPVETGRAQADRITLLTDAPPYPPDADGQAFLRLSGDYTGKALPVSVSGSTVAAIAAREDEHTVAVFVAGGDQAVNELGRVQVTGFHIRRIARARVLWTDRAHADAGPAQVSAAAATLVSAGGAPTAEFRINPGGEHRGDAWEIVELILSGEGGSAP